MPRTDMLMYERKENRSAWNNEYGDLFGCINCVHQLSDGV